MSKAIDALRRDVFDANQAIFANGLAQYTFGNVSGIDRERGLIAIKPSGVPYQTMRSSMIVVTDLDGNVVEGKLRASSDLPTHVVLYRALESIGGIVHTHSHYATAWAQAGRGIPCFGTTHADYFFGDIPVTEAMTDAEIDGHYEANTGHAIVRALGSHHPSHMPAVLVRNHASFAWGATPADAVHSAELLETVARMAMETLHVNPAAVGISKPLLNKHFLRKHGTGAYYGQPLQDSANEHESNTRASKK